jgi:membrane protein implicated in regulation of membrane protease activity
MDTTEKILLVILAAALALFLILAIVTVVLVIRMLKSVNRITQKAEQLVDSAETVGQVFKQTAEQMTFIRVIRNVADLVGKHHKNSRKGE